jgi:hypothetical protein
LKRRPWRKVVTGFSEKTVARQKDESDSDELNSDSQFVDVDSWQKKSAIRAKADPAFVDRARSESVRRKP